MSNPAPEGEVVPPRKRKVPMPPDGRLVEATVMGFQMGAEHWNEYFLDDGSVLRLKVVVTEVLHVEGEYDQNGNPAYVTQSTNIMTVSSPEELMRKEGE